MTPSLFDLNDLISCAEAARIRGVSRQSMSRLAAKGRFRAVTIGGRDFVSRKEIEAYVPLKPGRPFGSVSKGAEESEPYRTIPFPALKLAEKSLESLWPRAPAPRKKKKR
jgi:hypothetical protein